MAFPDDRRRRVGRRWRWGCSSRRRASSRARRSVWARRSRAAVIGGLVLAARAPRRPAARRSTALGLPLLGVLYVGFFIAARRPAARAAPTGWRWVLFTVFIAMGSDTGGYFAGRAFGRHKLTPGVSPSKTVEGALGARRRARCVIAARLPARSSSARSAAARRVGARRSRSACSRSSATSASRR